jgi:hypothetical protein
MQLFAGLQFKAEDEQIQSFRHQWVTGEDLQISSGYIEHRDGVMVAGTEQNNFHQIDRYVLLPDSQKYLRIDEWRQKIAGDDPDPTYKRQV